MVWTRQAEMSFYFQTTALRCSTFFRAWDAGLHEYGKCWMSVIGATIRETHPKNCSTIILSDSRSNLSPATPIHFIPLQRREVA